MKSYGKVTVIPAVPPAVIREARMLAYEWWNGAQWESLTDRQRADATEQASFNFRMGRVA